MTGVITLLKPTSKPYAGNVAEGGRVSTPYVYDVNTNYVYDDSIEGCTATPSDDFAYIGEVIGAKVANNRVTFQNSGRGGMLINSYYPMADIDIADNVVVGRTGGSTIIQMATGWRDIKIHDNDFTSYGTWVLNPSQGIINTTIEHNTFYTTNSEAIQFSGAYKLVINGNVFTVADSVNAYPQAVALGLSNGSCVHCTFSNNIVDLYPDFLFEIEAIAFMMAATPVFMRL